MMLRTAAVLAALVVWLPAEVAAQVSGPPVLRLAFDAQGRVNLSAQHVSLREILQEWARQCGCFVVNGDRLSGSALVIPFEFAEAPQRQVLGSLLRQSGGYVLTPRRPGTASVSDYETIYIVASSAPAGGATYRLPSPIVVTAVPVASPGSPDDEIPPVLPGPQAGTTPPMQEAPVLEPDATRAPAAGARGGIVVAPIVSAPPGPPAPAPPSTTPPGGVTPVPNPTPPGR
jgi:hypothetical protein